MMQSNRLVLILILINLLMRGIEIHGFLSSRHSIQMNRELLIRNAFNNRLMMSKDHATATSASPAYSLPKFLALSAAIFSFNAPPSFSMSPISTISGVAQLSPKTKLKASTGDQIALYVTVRQDKGIWQDQVRNFKQPPVLAKRIPINVASEFPLSFTIDENTDSTPEGKELASEWKSGKSALLITARLDMDGIASTRSSADLVGQTSTTLSDDGSGWKDFTLNLGGRGSMSRFITTTKP
jgi:hypothetical protein